MSVYDFGKTVVCLIEIPFEDSARIFISAILNIQISRLLTQPHSLCHNAGYRASSSLNSTEVPGHPGLWASADRDESCELSWRRKFSSRTFSKAARGRCLVVLLRMNFLTFSVTVLTASVSSCLRSFRPKTRLSRQSVLCTYSKRATW
jgi:hypothetical protein